MPLSLDQLAVGSFQSNCYLIADQDQAILIDAGAEPQAILDWIGDRKVELIVVTHGHRDHVGALEEVRTALSAPLAVHPADAQAFELYGEQALVHGDRISLGEHEFEVNHIPGHTPGSIALRLVSNPADWAVVGDAIFPGGPGMTMSSEALAQSLESLAATVFTWPDEVQLFPGHGQPTTVGAERADFEAFHAKPIPTDHSGDATWR
jgi:glyoxylase-like metal-dependent hydrolase (beta-lactamase superfamily II)